MNYTYSKSMNNVGEFFFSQPIDPFDLSKDWGRSDDDQRHRFVVNGTVNTPMTPATSTWERISHGFQLSGMLQNYSALPFNITSGVTTVNGTAGRPIVDGELHRAQRRREHAVFLARSPREPIVPDWSHDGRGDGGRIQPDGPHERRLEEHQLRHGRAT